MNIIVVSHRLDKAISLGPRELSALAMALTLLIGAAAFGLGMLFAPSRVEPLLRMMPGQHARQNEIDALAVQVGELQAKLTRLDGLASRVGDKTGIDIKPFLSQKAAPQGGLAHDGKPFAVDGLRTLLQDTDVKMAAMIDQLTLAEAILITPDASFLPRHAPLAIAPQSSSFGWRVDPFRGTQVFHEGIDYQGDTGTPIVAAATGKVVYAAYHPQYGNMVELDHGKDLTSRYAHASKLLVKVGDTVQVGQNVALLGSTGRSTGPHLHFEIRYRGVAQNPLRFLDAGQSNYAQASK
ncbi:M23 family metallopeptidase [Chitinibacter bivalviorum]|uniref:M23 family metallopeptidase n=1 Tax=Chitinibacter bivalviorum TaxID=2739434 RepID=A0A7H9BPW0_9NEIS|nr:M23 family metallopeptidase [Chitinibacter bivalviorum]QLG89384.1 M23 family metallopeptidase [Chitinibacter bivalviorum]